jgi:hypothetical protein
MYRWAFPSRLRFSGKNLSSLSPIPIGPRVYRGLCCTVKNTQRKGNRPRDLCVEHSVISGSRS